jgi:hypothetical protein
MPDPDAPRKPRRAWLIAPFVLVLIGFAALTGWWFYMRGQIEAGLDQLAEGGKGYSARYQGRHVGGYPFRFELTLDQATVSEPSGWGLAAPTLEVVASVFDPSHAVAVAPKGVVLSRPGKGTVAIDGQVLRASAGGFGKRPRFDVEARGITIRPLADSQPMPFASADLFEVHLRPEAEDVDRLFVILQGAMPTPGSLMNRVTDGKSNLQLEASLMQAHALRGRDWPSVLRNWQAAGGEMRIVRSQASVGTAMLSADGSTLGLDAEGRLHGKLDLRLTDGPAAMMALGATGVLPQETAAVGAGLAPRAAKFSLRFRDGQTMVGPIPIGKAPRPY